MDFFMGNQLRTEAFVTFVKSLSSFPSTSSLSISKVIAARLLTNFIFVL